MAQDNEAAVADHYAIGGLGERILGGLELTGADLNALRPVDLAPIDEFHMGGRAATAHVIGLMELVAGSRVLDLGSGLGGVARYLASECDCRATGIDLTAEFVDVARMLSDKTGLAHRTEFNVGSALDLPWPEASFDAATTFHVAMNISDRARFYGEAARVIRPGGMFAIYDAMKGPTPGMVFPVPWAETEETSFLVTSDEMRALLEGAGFEIVHDEDRREIALDHHRKRLAEAKAAGGPPLLGLHILQGETASLKSRNMLQMLDASQITLGAMIARRFD